MNTWNRQLLQGVILEEAVESGERESDGTITCLCLWKELMLQREDTCWGTPLIGMKGWHLPAQGAIGTLAACGDRQVNRQDGGGYASA